MGNNADRNDADTIIIPQLFADFVPAGWARLKNKSQNSKHEEAKGILAVDMS